MRKSGIDRLRTYFTGLKTPQKREFILNLKEKAEEMGSVKYAKFAAECSEIYNAEVKEARNKENNIQYSSKNDRTVQGDGARFLEAVKTASDTAMPDASTEMFAKTIASIFTKPQQSAAPRLVGKWERKTEDDSLSFHFIFHPDGSFETNDIEEFEVLRGFYKIDEIGEIMMEPLAVLQITSLSLTPSGHNLCIVFTDGSMREYTRVLKR